MRGVSGPRRTAAIPVRCDSGEPFALEVYTSEIIASFANVLGIESECGINSGWIKALGNHEWVVRWKAAVFL